MLPAQRSWRETVWLLDVMWPKVTNERARCCEKICSYITKVDTESSYKHPWRGVVHHCGPSLFLLSVAGDISFISFTGVAWDGKWEWWPCHMPENQRVLPSWSSWESICYVGIKISKLYELRNITLLEWLALHLCSHSTCFFFLQRILLRRYIWGARPFHLSAEFTGSLKFGSFVNNEPKNKIATLNLEKQNEFFIPGVTEGFFIFWIT